MNAENPYWSGRTGALIGIWNGELEARYPQLTDWRNTLSIDQESYSEFTAWLPGNSVGKSNAPMLRAIDPDGSGTLFWLYSILKDRVLPYRIDQNGITQVNTGINGIVPTYQMAAPFQIYNSPWTQKSFLRDADVEMAPFFKVNLAISDCHLKAYNAQTGLTDGVYPLLILRFDANTGEFIDAAGHELYGGNGLPNFSCSAQLPNNGGSLPPPAPDTPAGLNGVAFTPGAEKVILTGEAVNSTSTGWEPTIGILDLATSQWTNLISQLSIPDPVKIVRGRLYRNREPGTSDKSVYIPYGTPGLPPPAGSIAAIRYIDGFQAIQYQPGIFQTVPPSVTKYVEDPSIATNSYTPYFLNAQITLDRYVYNLADPLVPGCCAFRRLIGSQAGYTHTGSNGNSFTASNNPWGGVAEVFFSGDVVIPSGTQLTVHGMTWRFGPNAKLIVQRNARLNAYNSIFSTVECDDVLWPGIRVEGTTSDPVQHGSGHGQLRLYNSRVEHAQVGVWCAREGFNIIQPDYFGGVVRAYSSTFRDCVTGVRIERYHRIGTSGNEVPNFCYFEDCAFETTPMWRGVTTPGWFAKLTDVNGVTFSRCRFTRTNPYSLPYHLRGGGISATDAAFNCYGYGAYQQNRFENLYVGIQASTPDPAETYRVDGMGFKNCFKGIMDFGSTNPRITNNEFITMEHLIGTPPNVASMGIHLFQTEGYVVERNYFTDQGTTVPSAGIWFTGPTAQGNRIYDNTFEHLNIGCFVEGRHKQSTGNPFLAPGLQLLCGQHDDNIADQFVLGPQGYMRYQQGSPQSGNTTANNVFSEVDCTAGDANPSFNPYVFAFNDYGLDVRYYYYDNSSSPRLRPDCIEDIDGTPLSFIGDWFYDLQGVSGTGVFDAESNCQGGVLDGSGTGTGGIVGMMGQYQTKLGELRNAMGQYDHTVDRKQTGDVVGMINHQPWHPSYLLRDTLFAHYPLSDSVLLAVLNRGEPLDAWHLTQVLIENSPLTRDVWKQIDALEALPPYFYNLLLNYKDGDNLRTLLEQEVALRQSEVALLQVQLLDAIVSDSTYANLREDLDAIFLADSVIDGLRGQYLTKLYGYKFAEAEDLEPMLENNPDVKGVAQWGALYRQVGGDWAQLHAAGLQTLHNMAMGESPGGSALAWAALLRADALDSIPSPDVPATFKSLWQGKERANASAMQHMQVLPNPASDRVAFTYGAGLEHGTIELHDLQGRLAQRLPLNGRKGLVDFGIGHLPPGLYTASLILAGHRLATTKLSIVR